MRSIVLAGMMVLGLAASAEAVLTFEATWNNGSAGSPVNREADLTDDPVNYYFGGSFWQNDGADPDFGSIQINAFDAPHLGMWQNRQSMGGALSSAGGTVEFWFRPDPTDNDGGTLFYLEGFLPGVRQDILSAEYDATNLRIRLQHKDFGDGLGNFNQPINRAHPDGGAWISDGEFHHLAFTFDLSNGGSDFVGIYLDGVLLGNTNILTGPNATWDPDIGYSMDAGDRKFRIGSAGTYTDGTGVASGRYDDFRIYDTVLTAQEIADIAAAGRTVAPPTPSGDFDLDGDVDAFDFGIWQANFPMLSGAAITDGDADGDGDVDAFDFGIWQANFPTAPAGPSSVPEPATAVLVGMAGASMWLRRPSRT